MISIFSDFMVTYFMPNMWRSLEDALSALEESVNSAVPERSVPQLTVMSSWLIVLFIIFPG